MLKFYKINICFFIFYLKILRKLDLSLLVLKELINPNK
jgi:hypothetical protein